MFKGLLSIVVITVSLVALSLSGCRQRIGDFTILSSKNVNFSAIDAEAIANAEEFEGEDIKFWGIPNLEEALDDALRKGNGNVMVDAAMYFYNGFFTHGYIVKGKVVTAR